LCFEDILIRFEPCGGHFTEKFIFEYQSVFFEVSILPNFVCRNYPLGFESSMLIVVRVREVTSTCSDLFMESWPFRVLRFVYSLIMQLLCYEYIS